MLAWDVTEQEKSGTPGGARLGSGGEDAESRAHVRHAEVYLSLLLNYSQA